MPVPTRGSFGEIDSISVTSDALPKVVEILRVPAVRDASPTAAASGAPESRAGHPLAI
jgi:hypothetical protein